MMIWDRNISYRKILPPSIGFANIPSIKENDLSSVFPIACLRPVKLLENLSTSPGEKSSKPKIKGTKM